MLQLSYLDYLHKYGKIQKSVYIPLELDYWIRSIAENEGISVSKLIAGILEDYKEATE